MTGMHHQVRLQHLLSCILRESWGTYVPPGLGVFSWGQVCLVSRGTGSPRLPTGLAAVGNTALFFLFFCPH